MALQSSGVARTKNRRKAGRNFKFSAGASDGECSHGTGEQVLACRCHDNLAQGPFCTSPHNTYNTGLQGLGADDGHVASIVVRLLEATNMPGLEKT